MPAHTVGIYAKRNIIRLLAAVSLLLGSLLLAALSLSLLTAFAFSLLAAGSLFLRAGVMFGAFRAFCLR